MFGFEISYKGRTIEVGIPGGSILLYAGLLSRDAPQKEAKFEVVGYDSINAQNNKWLDETMDLGDEIEIRVIDQESFDPPSSVEPYKNRTDEEKVAHFHELKKTLSDEGLI